MQGRSRRDTQKPKSALVQGLQLMTRGLGARDPQFPRRVPRRLRQRWALADGLGENEIQARAQAGMYALIGQLSTDQQLLALVCYNLPPDPAFVHPSVIRLEMARNFSAIVDMNLTDRERAWAHEYGGPSPAQARRLAGQMFEELESIIAASDIPQLPDAGAGAVVRPAEDEAQQRLSESSTVYAPARGTSPMAKAMASVPPRVARQGPKPTPQRLRRRATKERRIEAPAPTEVADDLPYLTAHAAEVEQLTKPRLGESDRNDLGVASFLSEFTLMQVTQKRLLLSRRSTAYGSSQELVERRFDRQMDIVLRLEAFGLALHELDSIESGVTAKLGLGPWVQWGLEGGLYDMAVFCAVQAELEGPLADAAHRQLKRRRVSPEAWRAAVETVTKPLTAADCNLVRTVFGLGVTRAQFTGSLVGYAGGKSLLRKWLDFVSHPDDWHGWLSGIEQRALPALSLAAPLHAATTWRASCYAYFGEPEIRALPVPTSWRYAVGARVAPLLEDYLVAYICHFNPTITEPALGEAIAAVRATLDRHLEDDTFLTNLHFSSDIVPDPCVPVCSLSFTLATVATTYAPFAQPWCYEQPELTAWVLARQDGQPSPAGNWSPKRRQAVHMP